MSIKTYINKTRKKDKMVRLTKEQAIGYLVDRIEFALELNAIKESEAKKRIAEVMLLESNPLELKARLEKESKGKHTLKGSREATNISFAPKGTQSKYSEASSLVGSIDNFEVNGVEYTCGIYCKKVVKNKKKKKDDTK